MIAILLQSVTALYEVITSDLPDETVALQIKISVRDYIDEYGSTAIITLDEWEQLCPNVVGLILFARSKFRR